MELKDLTNEVRQVVNSHIEGSAEVLHPEWITTGIMGNHSDITGADADFAIIGCRAFVRNEVRQVLNALKKMNDESAPEQLIMDGFTYLQKYYAIERDGERCAVRIDLATAAELKAKAAEYRTMGRACFAHADEIDRYLIIGRDESAA